MYVLIMPCHCDMCLFWVIYVGLHINCILQSFVYSAKYKHYLLQESVRKWSLGCVNPASSLPLAAGHEFTQPRAHSFALPCTGSHRTSVSRFWESSTNVASFFTRLQQLHNTSLFLTRSAQLPHPARVSCSDLFTHG